MTEHNHEHQEPGDHIMNQLFQQYQQMHDYVERLEKAQIKLENTIEAINDLKNIKGNEKILAPIADGIFVEAKLLTKETVKVNIGTDTVIDKTIPETIKLLEHQKEELNKSITNAQQKIAELEQIFQSQNE